MIKSVSANLGNHMRDDSLKLIAIVDCVGNTIGLIFFYSVIILVAIFAYNDDGWVYIIAGFVILFIGFISWRFAVHRAYRKFSISGFFSQD